MTLYTRKQARELRAQMGLAIAVLAVTSLGIFLYITSTAAYLDLKTSYADTQARLGLADLHIDVAPLMPTQLQNVQALPGVAVADARVVTSVPVGVPGETSSRLDLRLLSVPPGAQPRLDQVLLISGRLPAVDGEVLLEKHLAEHHHLQTGAKLDVRVPGTPPRILTGVAESTEYLWTTRSQAVRVAGIIGFWPAADDRAARRPAGPARSGAQPAGDAAAGAVAGAAGHRADAAGVGGADARRLRACENLFSQALPGRGWHHRPSTAAEEFAVAGEISGWIVPERLLARAGNLRHFVRAYR